MKIKKEINKNYDDCSIIEKLAIEQGIAKAIDIPSAMRVSAQLLPEQVYTALQAIMDNSKFLKMITTHFCKGTTADLNLLSITANDLHNIAPGHVLPAGSEKIKRRVSLALPLER